MSERRAPYSTGNAPRNLALVRDALGQSGIDEGLKLARGLRVGSREVPAGQGDMWLEKRQKPPACRMLRSHLRLTQCYNGCCFPATCGQPLYI